MADRPEFIRLLSEYQDRAGLSDIDFGKLLNVGRQAVWGWKKSRSHPSYETVLKIVKVLRLEGQEQRSFINAAGYGNLEFQPQSSPQEHHGSYQDNVSSDVEGLKSAENNLDESEPQSFQLPVVGLSTLETYAKETLAETRYLDIGQRDLNAKVDILIQQQSQPSSAIKPVYKHLSSPSFPLELDVPLMPNGGIVGRETVIELLMEKLLSGKNSMLALEGAAGVGKTALALALAHDERVKAHFEDGVLWANLGAEGDGRSHFLKWAKILGVDLTHTDEVEWLNTVKNATGRRSLLLIIEDAWNIKAAQWLQCGGQQCCHLLTTRDRIVAHKFAKLNTNIVTVTDLSAEDAWELLYMLAPEACNADENAARSLLHAVGGLPIAMNVIGTYLSDPERNLRPDYSNVAFKAIQDSKSRLQQVTQRLGTDKRLTLQEIITLSLDALPEETQTALYALSAFAPKPESFDWEAAESVTQTKADSKILSHLITRNLIEQVNETQLGLQRVLHDAICIWENPETIERHRDYYLKFANKNRDDWQKIEEVYGQIKWAWKATSDIDVLIQFVVDLSIYQTEHFLWNDFIEWRERLLLLADHERYQELRGALLQNIGFAYRRLKLPKKSIIAYEKSIDIFKMCHEDRYAAYSLASQAAAYYENGQTDMAVIQCQEAMRIFREMADKAGERNTLRLLAQFFHSQGKVTEAISALTNCLTVTEELGDESLSVLRFQSDMYYEYGFIEKAYLGYQHCLEIAEDLGDEHDKSIISLNLADIYFDNVTLKRSEPFSQEKREDGQSKLGQFVV